MQLKSARDVITLSIIASKGRMLYVPPVKHLFHRVRKKLYPKRRSRKAQRTRRLVRKRWSKAKTATSIQIVSVSSARSERLRQMLLLMT